MPQKLNFFIYLLDTTFQTPIPYSSTTHMYHLLQHLIENFTCSPSLIQLPRSYAFCIVSASFSPPHSWYSYTGALSALVWSMYHMCGGAPCTQLSWTEWSLKLFVSSVLLLSLTVFSLLNSVAMLPLFLSSIVIFTLTALLKLLTACLPSFRCLAAHALLLKLIPLLSKSLMHELISIFTLSSLFTGKLCRDLPLSVFPLAYDLNSLKRRVLGHFSSRNWPLFSATL